MRVGIRLRLGLVELSAAYRLTNVHAISNNTAMHRRPNVGMFVVPFTLTLVYYKASAKRSPLTKCHSRAQLADKWRLG